MRTATLAGAFAYILAGYVRTSIIRESEKKFEEQHLYHEYDEKPINEIYLYSEYDEKPINVVYLYHEYDGNQSMKYILSRIWWKKKYQ